MSSKETRNAKYSKSFKYKDGQLNYDLNLQKRRPWWIILLLLVPLFLLIRCSKEITIVTVDPNGDPIENVSVDLSFTEYQLLKNKQFSYHGVYQAQRFSDENGKAVFKKAPFSLYSWLFKGKELAHAEAEKGKLKGSTDFKYHRQSRDTIVLGWELPIEVRWRKNQAPVPEATLIINYEDNVELYMASLVTDENGSCVLKIRTMDGRIKMAVVTKEGTSGTLVFDEHFEDHVDGRPFIIYLDEDARCSNQIWTSTQDNAWYSVKTFDLGKEDMDFKFSYCSRIVPDLFQVYEGTPDMIAYQTANLLFSYGDKVDTRINPRLLPSEYESLERTGFDFLSNTIHSKSRQITVMVICKFPDETWWEYKVECQ